MKYYFFKEDYEELLAQIDRLRAEMRATGEDSAESARQSSETWHDNFGFEDGQRSLVMLSRRLGELEAVAKLAEVVTAGSAAGSVRMGSTVSVEDTETGETKTLRIGSYMKFGKGNDAISYASPMANLIMGAAEGDIREGQVGRTHKSLRVVSIS